MGARAAISACASRVREVGVYRIDVAATVQVGADKVYKSLFL